MSNKRSRNKTSHPSPVREFPQQPPQGPKLLTGKASNGFCWRVNPQVMDNMELVELLATMNDDDPLALPGVCTMVLGDKQKRKLYEFVRTPDNRVPVSEITKTIMEIFQAIGQPGKN